METSSLREVDDQHASVEEAETIKTETADLPPQSNGQDVPKELTDQKKTVAAPESSEPEPAALAPPSAPAPPVKTAAPVKQAKVDTEAQQPPAPPTETVEGTPEVMETVAMTKTVEKEPVPEVNQSDRVDTVQEKAEHAEDGAAATAALREKMIEKLLDTNSCYECDLTGVDLSGKDLSGADLEGSDLSGAILNKTDLAGTNLKGVSLRGAQLIDADLRRADLYKADLSDADLTDADFRGALTDEADFSGALGYQPALMVE